MKIKRPISAILILALLLSCICIFASAESESYTGVYNGKSYYASAYAAKDELRVYLTYADSSAKLRIEAAYKYENQRGIIQSSSFVSAGKASTGASKFPQDIKEFVSMTPSYLINGNLVLKFTVSA